ncbi:MAG TPA: thioredoxin domain-containing protein [Candidatus Dormibacteraeota bacterium]|nr:thioredoxin domain-containing protein [Candidatus Dormibacteraeota bacterium]
MEFNDFMCPYCSKMVPVIDKLVDSYPGKIRLIVKDFPLELHPGSALAHEACLAAKAQNNYWQMFHLLFANQQHLQRSDLLEYAKQLHLDLAKFESALDTHQYKSAILESVAEGKALGVTATPTFFITGRKVEGAQSFEFLQERVQTALGTDQPPHDDSSGQGLKLAEGNVANAPVRGSPDAAVTITEYADFQCPFCASARSSVDQVLREYPSRVKLVFKSFPLDFHADSRLAHQAALAADKQGKFWEMHDLIFARQRTIKRDDLFAVAKSLGLDMDRFAKDVQSEEVRAQIEAERAEGQRKGVQGTPTFYIDGEELVGAASVAQFEAGIDRSLRAKGIEPARLPITADGGPARGPEHAPVTVLWYSDVASPLAVQANRLMEQVLDSYPREVRVVFKNRPLEFHRDAVLAHQALMAAAAQGKFWAMHSLLLANQSSLTAPQLADYAGQIGLDTRKFVADLSSQKLLDQVQRDVSQARDAGINGVPVFFVNGARVDGVQPLSSFKAIVDEQIQKTRVAMVHE